MNDYRIDAEARCQVVTSANQEDGVAKAIRRRYLFGTGKRISGASG